MEDKSWISHLFTTLVDLISKFWVLPEFGVEEIILFPCYFSAKNTEPLHLVEFEKLPI
jgi:hypothetical protein